MCSQNDDPTQYDGPVVTRPRAYTLSGSIHNEPKPSIALAVIGTMIDEIESLDERNFNRIHTWQLLVLRTARQRIAKAEAEA